MWRKAYTTAPRKGRISRITRPKVLLVVGHPGIGAALEGLLQIEDRYEVRRVQSLDLVGAGDDGWTADLALIDGLLVQGGQTAALTMPAIVLSGNAADGKRLAAALPNGRGWLRKDATAGELRTAIDQAPARGGLRRAPANPLALSLALLLIAVIVVAAWYLFGFRV